MGFGNRLMKVLDMKEMTRADLRRLTGLKSSNLVPYIKNQNASPKLSTAMMIAEALEVSLDYLAGRTNNPMGFCDEELEGLLIDAESRAMLRGFSSLPPDGRDSVMEQVELQQLKSAKEEMRDHRIPRIV